MILEDRILLLIVIWDDPRGLMRILEQDTVKQFDGIMVIDGKFKGWEGDPEFNEDECKNIITDWAETCKVPCWYESTEGRTESQKRNFAFFKAYKTGFTWCLVCDSDEIPWFNKDMFDEEAQNLRRTDLGCFSVILNNYGLIQRRPRLFRLREQPYLINNHSEIMSTVDGRDMADDLTKLKYDIQSIELLHNKEFYSKYRFKSRNKYMATKH